jgi:fucose permease
MSAAMAPGSAASNLERNMRRQVRPAVLVSYAGFVLVGVNSGVSGVLLPSQMASYGVDRATIGITFFAIAAGFALAGLGTGTLIHRFGVRISLATAGGAYILSMLYLAIRPPFAAFVLAQVVTGFATGIFESALNVYLAGLPGAASLLNRLHGFFGVGALTGPPLAAWIVGFASWTGVCFVLALACIPSSGFPAGPPGTRADGPATGPAAWDA